jgi:hypothetical protein
MRSAGTFTLALVASLGCGGPSAPSAATAPSTAPSSPATATSSAALPPPSPVVVAGDAGSSESDAALGSMRAGALFGSGTLDTGWGAGGERGYGTGRSAGASDADAGAAGSAQQLTPEQIRRVVLAHRGALRACYEMQAQKDPTLAGGVTATWTIDPTGVVTSAAISGSTLGNAAVEGCVLRQVRSWRFPESAKPSNVNYPFKFGAGTNPTP